MKLSGKPAGKILIVLLCLVLAFGQCLSAAAEGETVYTCGEAAEMLRVHADAYRSPAQTAEEILNGAEPDAPLTRMAGCEMLLRAFGPLPDVQEGVRYLIKYRNCAFTDVPEEGKAAVENLTNAGLYIPEDNAVFGPDELMTEHELFLLTDRIHAYLQSSLKDDFYSWTTAALLNDPGFLAQPYDMITYNINTTDENRDLEWMISMLNDCLEHPDTPENANIAAFLSTYMDQEAREESMTEIQPMIDSIWNASDFTELMNACADICHETGIELLLNTANWNDWRCDCFAIDDDHHLFPAFEIGDFSARSDPGAFQPGAYTHDVYVERKSRLLSCLGIGQEEAEAVCANYMQGYRYEGQLQYNAIESDQEIIGLDPENVPAELSFFPWASYLERAGYPGDKPVAVRYPADMAIALKLMSQPENLPGIKANLVYRLVAQLEPIVPNRIRDRSGGFWGDYYAADPSRIFRRSDLIYCLMPMIQKDVYTRYVKSEEYTAWYERLSIFCRDILADYRQMLEQTSWMNEATLSRALDKLDGMQFRLMIPTDVTNFFQVDYVSAEEGGTLYENTIRYLKARREWLFRCEDASDYVTVDSVLGNCWERTYYYSRMGNTFILLLSGLISTPIEIDTADEEIMGRLAFSIAHEISHAFDFEGSRWNEKGEWEDCWTEEDRTEFTARCGRLASYLDGYEFFPGIAVRDGWQIVNETLADLTALKCLMRIAARIPGFDYRKFFEAFADMQAVSATRGGAVNYLLPNEHATGRCRVNRLMSLIDEFYETYDIQPGDAMYVAPEDRPCVW